MRETNIKRHGCEYPIGTPEYRRKSRNTCRKRYGVDNPLQIKEVREKAKKTMLRKYGVEYNMQSAEIMAKARRKYLFEGTYFDSGAEIALYVWCRDKKIKCEYHPDVHFEYSVNGQICTYWPDFKIGRKLVEIKGDQYLKEDGTWKDPYNKDKSKQAEQDAKYEAKHQCALQNGVKIFYSADYLKYVRYVQKTYGRNFLLGLKAESKKRRHR